MLPHVNNLFPIFLKVFAIIGGIFYFVFSLIVVKQVSSLSKNIQDRFNGLIVSASYIHLIFAGLLVFLVLILL